MGITWVKDGTRYSVMTLILRLGPPGKEMNKLCSYSTKNNVVYVQRHVYVYSYSTILTAIDQSFCV